MSKSKKNYPDPTLVIDKYGVDSLRLYLMSSTVMKGENLNFKEEEVNDIRKNVINIWWNVYVFYQSVGGASQEVSDATNVLDRWIISRLSTLCTVVTDSMNNYDTTTATRALMSFVRDLSNWYVRLSRERLRNSSESRAVLRYVLKHYSLLMAPFAPFMAERIFQSLGAADSVHLESWPKLTGQDTKLEEEMTQAMSVVEAGHHLRQKASLRLRQPLASATTSCQLSPELLGLVAAELNVKVVKTTKEIDGSLVALDTKLTKELVEEGQARDLVRAIQGERKKLGLMASQSVVVELPSWPATWEGDIKARVGATSLSIGPSLKVYAK